MSDEPFTGFPQAGVEFLAALAHNNNREWFEANKKTFQTQLQAPAQAFVSTLGQRLQTAFPNIVYDTRVNGSGSLMRMYRDTRFSKDKTPYKTNVTMMFWDGPSKRAAYSGVYIRLEPTACALMVGLPGFEKATLAAYREAVLDETMGTELQTIIAEVEALDDYKLNESHYKRVPRGFDADHPRSDLLRNNSLHASTVEINAEHLTSTNLVDVFYNHSVKLAPIHHWLVKLAEKSK